MAVFSFNVFAKYFPNKSFQSSSWCFAFRVSVKNDFLGSTLATGAATKPVPVRVVRLFLHEGNWVQFFSPSLSNDVEDVVMNKGIFRAQSYI